MKKALRILALSMTSLLILSIFPLFSAQAEDTSNFLDIANTCNESYSSVIDLSDDLYSYDEMIADMDQLVSLFPSKVRKEVIGYSELGREIGVLVIGDDTAPNRYFAMGESHAREYLNSMLLMKNAEFYLRNWDNTLNGEKLSDLFARCQFYFLPMHNPDGTMLVQQGLASLNVIQDSAARQKRIDFLTGLMETMNAAVSANTSEHDTGWTAPQSGQYDFTYWKSNINGVDVHNNFWTEGTYDYVKSYNAFVSLTGSNKIARPHYMDYFGTEPLSQSETRAVADYCDEKRFNIAITYHMMGEIYQWSHGFDMSGDTVRKAKASTIADRFSAFMGHTKSGSNDYFIGFSGYYRYLYPNAYNACIELGNQNYFKDVAAYPNWAHDGAPGHIEQLTTDVVTTGGTTNYCMWHRQKFTPAYMAKYLIDNNLVPPAGNAIKDNVLTVSDYSGAANTSIVVLKSEKLESGGYKVGDQDMHYSQRAGGYAALVPSGTYSDAASALQALTKQAVASADVDYEPQTVITAQKAYNSILNMADIDAVSNQLDILGMDPVCDEGVFGITLDDVRYLVRTALGLKGWYSSKAEVLSIKGDDKTESTRFVKGGQSGSSSDKITLSKTDICSSAEGTTFTLSQAVEVSPGASAEYFSDASCATEINSVRLTPTQRTAKFYGKLTAENGNVKYYEFSLSYKTNEAKILTAFGQQVKAKSGDGNTTQTAYTYEFDVPNSTSTVSLGDMTFSAGILNKIIYLSGTGSAGSVSESDQRALNLGNNNFYIRLVSEDGSIVWNRMLINRAYLFAGAEITGISHTGGSTFSTVFSKSGGSGTLNDKCVIEKNNYVSGYFTFVPATTVRMDDGATVQYYDDAECTKPAAAKYNLTPEAPMTCFYAKAVSAGCPQGVYYKIILSIKDKDCDNTVSSVLGIPVTLAGTGEYQGDMISDPRAYISLDTVANTFAPSDILLNSAGASAELYSTPDYSDAGRVTDASPAFIAGRAAGAINTFYVKTKAARGDVFYGKLFIRRTLPTNDSASTELSKVIITTITYDNSAGTASAPKTVIRGGCIDRQGTSLVNDIKAQEGCTVKFYTDSNFNSELSSTIYSLNSSYPEKTAYVAVTAPNGITKTYYVIKIRHTSYSG